MKSIVLSLALLAALSAGASSNATHTSAKPRRIAVTVTQKGFEPATIPVKVGEPVVLVVTRRTTHTCATEIVIADRKLRKKLPLDTAVEVPYTAKKAGSVRFACGMDMIAGALVAQ
jgi:plastocyanin domain-containing protein